MEQNSLCSSLLLWLRMTLSQTETVHTVVNAWRDDFADDPANATFRGLTARLA